MHQRVPEDMASQLLVGRRACEHFLRGAVLTVAVRDPEEDKTACIGERGLWDGPARDFGGRLLWKVADEKLLAFDWYGKKVESLCW